MRFLPCLLLLLLVCTPVCGQQSVLVNPVPEAPVYPPVAVPVLVKRAPLKSAAFRGRQFCQRCRAKVQSRRLFWLAR